MARQQTDQLRGSKEDRQVRAEEGRREPQSNAILHLLKTSLVPQNQPRLYETRKKTGFRKISGTLRPRSAFADCQENTVRVRQAWSQFRPGPLAPHLPRLPSRDERVRVSSP